MTESLTKVFDGHQVRIELDDNGNPLFRAADVCPHLGLDDTRQAIERLPDDEKVKKIHQVVSSKLAFPPPSIEWWVTEGGLYWLIMTSRKPEAQKFKRWVTHEVLPSIRKTGAYGAPKLDLSDITQLAPVALQLVELVQKQQKQLAEAKPKVEFYDKFAIAEGCLCLRDAAKQLGKHPIQWLDELRIAGYLYRQADGVNRPYSKWLDAKLFQYTSLVVDGHIRQQTLVTPAGLQYFARRSESLALVGDEVEA